MVQAAVLADPLAEHGDDAQLPVLGDPSREQVVN
jgi:hypothetical protein